MKYPCAQVKMTPNTLEAYMRPCRPYNDFPTHREEQENGRNLRSLSRELVVAPWEPLFLRWRRQRVSESRAWPTYYRTPFHSRPCLGPNRHRTWPHRWPWAPSPKTSAALQNPPPARTRCVPSRSVSSLDTQQTAAKPSLEVLGSLTDLTAASQKLFLHSRVLGKLQ